MKAYTTKLNGKSDKVRIEMTADELVVELQSAMRYGDGKAIQWIKEGWDTDLSFGNGGLVVTSTAPEMKPCVHCEDGWDADPGDDGKKQLCRECGGDREVIA